MPEQLVPIHHLQVFHETRTELDPQKGIVRRSTEVLKQGSASVIAKDGQEYEIDETGTFNVPGALAEEFCRKPEWALGPNPFHEEAPVKSARTRTKAA